MNTKKLAFALTVFAVFAPAAQAQTEIQFWHSMGGALGEATNELATRCPAQRRHAWLTQSGAVRAWNGVVFSTAYSTVTDFARFLGLSTSVPRASAV